MPMHKQMENSLSSGSVTLFTDIHRVLSNPDVLMLLSDFDRDKKNIGRAVVIAPFAEIPPELERISAVLHHPLPNIEQLRPVLDTVCVKTKVLLVEDDIEALLRVGKGLIKSEAQRAFTRALIAFPEDATSARKSVEQDKRRALARSSVLEFVDDKINFDDVGGMDHLKKWLGARRKAFLKEARDFGLPVPKGMLLMGIQGCGKSLAAKAVGGFWELPVVRLDIFSVFGHRDSEQVLNRALLTSEAMSPCILWIDEIEKGFDAGGDGKSSRLLGTLITWLQEKKSEVFVVATANKVESLPPELARKGRFDEIFFVDLPDPSERKDIFKLHLLKRNLEIGSFDLNELVARSEKMTGSEIEQIVIAGMYTAFERGEKTSQQDLIAALKSTVTLYETFEKEIKNLREWARTHARIASSDRSRLDLFK
jgi:SpoVK/Ycf46/Vps4 family AAA+-type ATPase